MDPFFPAPEAQPGAPNAFDDDRRWMRRALVLARRGLGRVAPNPPVGCVLVRDGRAVGAGWHRAFGGPHAEAEALAAAGGAARGATAYVTLMPCAHRGRQPPCADALVRAGVARVIAAVDDPNPAAAGGREILERAGVPVAVGCLGGRASALMRGFLTRVTAGRPFVTLKYALTLDGRAASASGDSRWISSAESRRLVHRWRADADAVLVGAGTALADNPALTVRDIARGRDGGSPPQPRRVVFDSRGRTPAAARLFSPPGGPVVICCGPDASADAEAAWRARGAAVERIPLDAEGHIDALAALRRLASHHGIGAVLCEGGAELAAGLLAAGAVDEVAAFVAPKIVGGRGAPGAIGGAGAAPMAAATPLDGLRVRRVGCDILLIGSPRTGTPRNVDF